MEVFNPMIAKPVHSFFDVHSSVGAFTKILVRMKCGTFERFIPRGEIVKNAEVRVRNGSFDLRPNLEKMVKTTIGGRSVDNPPGNLLVRRVDRRITSVIEDNPFVRAWGVGSNILQMSGARTRIDVNELVEFGVTVSEVI